MEKIKEWMKSRTKKPEARYEEDKEEFEKAMGKSFIDLKVEIPDGFDDLKREFLDLEKDEDFHGEVEDLVKKRLILERKRKKRRKAKKR